jgi:DNA-binding transcriptional ArsR family regulator
MAYDILTLFSLVIAEAIAIIWFLLFLFRSKDFSKKYVDIKEVPLHINNALKDKTKRDIIRSLRKEKKYLTLIARETQESVAKTKYHLHELEKLGIIVSMKLTREKFFLLTDRGKMCLKAIYLYYPRKNFEKFINNLRHGELKWKEKGTRSNLQTF